MLVNFNKMLNKAKDKSFAIPHFNINNLEWTKYILEQCEEEKVPVILGVSESAAKYMGGYSTVVGIVECLIKDLKITIDVCLHLDHGKSIESCKKALDVGFSSVMIDASSSSLEENIKITKEVVEYAHDKSASVEAEIGYIGGNEDGEKQNLLNAKVEDCEKLYNETNIDALAPALGSVHGLYKGTPNLDFVTMKEINEKIPLPLVLHGGSGILDYQIKEAIACGTTKINVNTELQIAWSKAVREFLENNNEVYDPRKVINSGEQAIKQVVKDKITLFETKKYYQEEV